MCADWPRPFRFEKHVGAASAPLAAGYRPRKPARTILYRTVQDHLETMLVEARERSAHGFGYPRHVERAFALTPRARLHAPRRDACDLRAHALFLATPRSEAGRLLLRAPRSDLLRAALRLGAEPQNTVRKILTHLRLPTELPPVKPARLDPALDFDCVDEDPGDLPVWNTDGHRIGPVPHLGRAPP